MTKHKGKTGLIDVKELLQRDEDFLRAGTAGAGPGGTGGADDRDDRRR